MSKHHSRQAQAGTRFTTEPHVNPSTKRILAFFIERTRQITEFRLQKLAFYAEYFHYQETGERLTNIEYKPYMYGMYSHDIRDALEDISCKTKPDYRRGKVVTAYLEVHEPIDLSGINTEFLDEIYFETKEVTSEDLAEFTKNVPMYKITEYGTVAEFNDRTVESPSH